MPVTPKAYNQHSSLTIYFTHKTTIQKGFGKHMPISADAQHISTYFSRDDTREQFPSKKEEKRVVQSFAIFRDFAVLNAISIQYGQ